MQGGACYQSQQQWESGPGGTIRASAITPAHPPHGLRRGVGLSPTQNPGEIGAQACQEVIPVSRSALSFLISESQIVPSLSPNFHDSWVPSKEAAVPLESALRKDHGSLLPPGGSDGATEENSPQHSPPYQPGSSETHEPISFLVTCS